MKATLDVSGDTSCLVIRGAVNEDSEAELFELRALIKTPKLEVNLAQVEHMNSIGIARWVSFIGELRRRVEIRLLQCPPVFVEYLGVVPMIAAGCTIESIFIPYRCERCNRGVSELVHLEGMDRAALAVAKSPCAKCGERLVPEQFLEDYLVFLDG